VLELRLINATQIEFYQDTILRTFVTESARRGVIVDVYDFKTGKLLIQPEGQVVPTEPR
jgi:hypothetical protein